MTGRLWPAALLAFLIGVGTIKQSSVLAGTTYDLTQLTVALLLLAAADAIFGASLGRRYTWLGWLGGAFGVAAFGLFRAPDATYANDKLLPLFLATLGLSFGGGMLLVRTERQRWAFLAGTVGVGVLVAVLAKVAPAVEESGLVALSGAETIGPGQLLLAGVVVLVVAAASGRLRLIVAVPLTAVLLGVAVDTGSRGPLVALGVALATLIPFAGPKVRRRAWVVFVVLAVLAFRTLTDASASAQQRLLLLFSNDQGASVGVRESIWGTTWRIVGENPLGLGWGGLAPELYPLARYPHNLFLEVAGEAGWVALAGLVVALVAAVRRAAPAARAGDASVMASIALLTYWLTNAMVSGDVNDNRGVFVMLGICLAVNLSQEISPRVINLERRSLTSA